MSGRVVTVEKNELESRVLGLVLQNSGFETVPLVNEARAPLELGHLAMDLAIISVELDGSDGFSIYRQLRSEGYGGPVIFTSDRSDAAQKLKAFELGADDYIVKPFDPLELVARVESVIRRFRLAEERAQNMLISVDDARLSVGRLTYKSEVVPETVLTPTEMKILECLMRNHGITISRSMLNERVRGFDADGDSNRIDVYIRRVRRKIERNPAEPEYLHTVRGIGYVFAVKRAGGRSRSVAAGSVHSVAAE